EQPCPLPNAVQPQAFVLLSNNVRVKTNAVILYNNANCTITTVDEDAGIFCLSIPGNIGQSFLHDAIDAGFLFGWQTFIQTIGSKVNLYRVPPSIFCNIPLQRHDQPQVIQHTWT